MGISTLPNLEEALNKHNLVVLRARRGKSCRNRTDLLDHAQSLIRAGDYVAAQKLLGNPSEIEQWDEIEDRSRGALAWARCLYFRHHHKDLRKLTVALNIVAITLVIIPAISIVVNETNSAGVRKKQELERIAYSAR